MTENVLKFRVTGRVQGVWFRGWTQDTAEGLGLRGWVRNEEDGSVSGVIAGPAPAVEKMLAALETGPQLARVDAVEKSPGAEEPGPGFEIRR